MKNKIISCIFLGIIVIFSVTYVFASYADFDEEAAEKKNAEMIKEQEKEHNVTQVKSSDNYLKNIQIDGYTLMPEFDKQILEYTINEEIKESEINIKADTSNEKASVYGTGKIEIEKDKKEQRIDVTAENGSVRTYIIKFRSDNESDKKVEETLSENIIAADIEQEKNQIIDEQPKEENNVEKYIIIGSIILILLVAGILFRKKGKKNGKRYK